MCRTWFAVALCFVLGACGRSPDDVDRIQTSGILRAGGVVEPGHLTPVGQSPRGYTAELISAMADSLGVTPQWQRFDSIGALCAALLGGDIDIVAAALTSSTAKPCGDSNEVAYGPHLERSSLVLAYRHGHKRPRGLSDLADLRISSIRAAADGTRDTLFAMTPDLARMQRGLADIAAGRADTTPVVRSLLDNMQTVFPRLAFGFDTGRALSRVWVFRRAGSSRLRTRALLLLRGQDAKLMRERELGHRGKANRAALIALENAQQERLPQYAGLFARAARQYGLDHHLLAAVGYQESRWQPRARSPTGVRGLMMLTRHTAREMGVKNRLDPRESINGGSRYLARLKRRLAGGLTEPERTWFALASYNLGLGHVRDARRVTRLLGGNDASWLDVDRHLPLLESPQWRRKLKYGFARGTEAQRYVANIRHFYDALAFAALRAELLQSAQQRPTEKPSRTPDDAGLSVVAYPADGLRCGDLLRQRHARQC